MSTRLVSFDQKRTELTPGTVLNRFRQPVLLIPVEAAHQNEMMSPAVTE